MSTIPSNLTPGCANLFHVSQMDFLSYIITLVPCCYNLGRNYLMQAITFIVLIILSKRIFPSMKLRKRWNFLGRCLPLVIRVRLPCYLRLESPALPPMDLPHPGGHKPPHLPNRKLRQWNTSISVPALSQHFPHLTSDSPHLYSNLRSTLWYNLGRHCVTIYSEPYICPIILEGTVLPYTQSPISVPWE